MIQSVFEAPLQRLVARHAGVVRPANAPAIDGTYVSAQDPSESLTLRPDRTFILYQHGRTRQGRYAVSGARLILLFADGGRAIGRLHDENTLIDADGERWIKGTP